MTAKEKVMKVWPDAYAHQYGVLVGQGAPGHFTYQIFSPDIALSSDYESEEAAWQNAAESLPAEPEPCNLNGIPGHNFTSPTDVCEPVASLPPVEVKEMQVNNGSHWCRFCSKITYHDPASSACLNCGTIDQHSTQAAEAKPSPDLDAAFENLWDSYAHDRLRGIRDPQLGLIILDIAREFWHAAIKKAETR